MHTINRLDNLRLPGVANMTADRRPISVSFKLRPLIFAATSNIALTNSG